MNLPDQYSHIIDRTAFADIYLCKKEGIKDFTKGKEYRVGIKTLRSVMIIGDSGYKTTFYENNIYEYFDPVGELRFGELVRYFPL